MGDSCSRLAVKLLRNIALGRGAALASDTVSKVCSVLSSPNVSYINMKLFCRVSPILGMWMW